MNSEMFAINIMERNSQFLISVSSVSTPISVHKENLQNNKIIDSSKKPKGSSIHSTSSNHPSSGGTIQSSNAQYSQHPSSTTPSLLQQSNNTSYAHSSRFPVNSQQNNNLVLDLISIRPNSQQNFNNNLCNYSLAIPSEGNNNENTDLDPSAIEESILETFQRIDAQNVSNSYEIEDDSEQKMSIIENPLSESVIEPSRAEVKTIPFHKVTEPTPSRISDTSLYTTPSPVPAPSNILLAHPIQPLQHGSDVIVLNNRVDELTK